MVISYAITVCHEFVEIQRLIPFLLQHKRTQDNIVILYDEGNGDPEIETYLRSHSINGEFAWYKGKFERHFADWKNKLTSLCSGDYIFQIDADEYPSEDLIQALPEIIELNHEMDIYLVPRVNTVEGLTPEHIAKWGWNVTDTGWVNWPDFQWRIWRNVPEIKWVNKVHERLDGFKTYTMLPDVEYFALYHPKTIEKQEKQNSYYDTL
jgi:glycosyltransferase involved in cell wall biosynthesis